MPRLRSGNSSSYALSPTNPPSCGVLLISKLSKLIIRSKVLCVYTPRTFKRRWDIIFRIKILLLASIQSISRAPLDHSHQLTYMLAAVGKISNQQMHNRVPLRKFTIAKEISKIQIPFKLEKRESIQLFAQVKRQCVPDPCWTAWRNCQLFLNPKFHLLIPNDRVLTFSSKSPWSLRRSVKWK